MSQIGDIIISLEARLDKFQRGMDQANKQLDSVDRNSKNLSRSFENMERVASRVGLVMKGIVLGGVIQSIGSAALAAERLTNSLRFATGSAEGAADALSFVRSESDRLGLQATKTAEAFSGIAAAAQGTALQGDAVREIFLGVAEASAALNLSADNTEGALLALSQMISKGTVQAEELRGQLGERIPGAFQIAARAMGVTTAELGKMLEKGEVIADEFLPRFAAEMRSSFGGAATQAATGLNAAINRLSNSYDELLRTMAETGAIDAATTIITNFSNILFNVAFLANQAKNKVQEFFDRFRDTPTTVEVLSQRLSSLSSEIIRVSKLQEEAFAGGLIGEAQSLAKRVESLRSEYNRLQKAYSEAAKSADGLTLSATEAAGIEPPKDYTDEIEKLRNQLDKTSLATAKYNERIVLLQKALDAGSIAQSEFNKLSSLAKKELDRVIESANKTGKAYKEVVRELTAMEQAQAKFNDAIANYPAQQIVRELDEQLEAQDRARESAERFADQANPTAQVWEDAATRINSTFTDTFRDILDDGIDGFKDLSNRVLDIFKGILAQMATLAIARPIIVPITSAIGGALGVSSAAQANVLGQLGGGGFTGFGGFGPEAISSLGLSTGISEILASSSFATNPLTSGIGGFGGNVAANALLGGNRGAGANIGGTLGAIGGSFLPLPPGIGTAIGGFLGNAIGGLFGGGEPARKAAAGIVDLETGQLSAFDAERDANETTINAVKSLTGFIERTLDLIDRRGLEVSGANLKVEVNEREGVIVGTGPKGGRPFGDIKQTFGEDAQAAQNFIAQFLADNISGALDSLDQVFIDRLRSADIEQLTADMNAFGITLSALEQAANPAEVIGPFEASLRQLQATFNAGSESAGRLGLSVDEMQANFDKAAGRISDEFDRQIQDAILGITDPFALELQQLEQQFEAIRKEAEAVGGDLVAVERLFGLRRTEILERQLEAQERAAKDAATAIGDAVSIVKDQVDALKTSVISIGQANKAGAGLALDSLGGIGNLSREAGLSLTETLGREISASIEAVESLLPRRISRGGFVDPIVNSAIETLRETVSGNREAISRINQLNSINPGFGEQLFELEKWYEQQKSIASRNAESLALLEQTFAEKREDILTGSLDNIESEFQRASRNISDFLRGLQIDESLSPLKPMERLAEAQRQFSEIVGQARVVDIEALNSVTGIAQDLLSVGRDVFASGSGFGEIFKTVNRDLGVLATRFQQGDPNKGVVDQLKKSRDEARDDAEDLMREVIALRREVSALKDTVGQPIVRSIDRQSSTLTATARR